MEIIKEEITEEVKSLVRGWKPKEGNLIMALHAIQNYYGYVPRNISMFLSEELAVPLARIYEVITFYNYFLLEPPAEYTVSVCTGTACHLKGSPAILAAFKKELNIPVNGSYTEDRKFKVQEVRCIGCCGLAPAITINNEVFGKVKSEQVPDLIKNAVEKQ